MWSKKSLDRRHKLWQYRLSLAPSISWKQTGFLCLTEGGLVDA